MTRAESSVTDAEMKFFRRVPAILSAPGGFESPLRNILTASTRVEQDDSAGVYRTDFTVNSPVGNMHAILMEIAGDEGAPKTHLVNLSFVLIDEGHQTPMIDVWWGGPYGLAGTFGSTNTDMKIAIREGNKRTTASLIFNLQGPNPDLRLHADRFASDERVPSAQLKERMIVLPGERVRAVGLCIEKAVTLFDVEGVDQLDDYFAFHIMGVNPAGAEKPVSVTLPKRITVC